jgi:hypothetical protein
MGEYIPSRESELVPYTNNFATQLTAAPTAVGCTVLQATTFSALNTTWTTSYATANAPATRTHDAILAKNAAKQACIANLRMLAGIIQKYPGTTDVLRAQFGLTVPKARSPIPVPTEIPVVEVTKRYGTTVIIRLHDGTARKSKPAGVQGARVYTFVGANPPVEVTDWFEEGQTTRTDVELNFDPATPAGSTVWITAAWYNPRGQLGPGAQPISTVIAGGAMELAA